MSKYIILINYLLFNFGESLQSFIDKPYKFMFNSNDSLQQLEEYSKGKKMSRGPLYELTDYKPLFSGHETFYLRYGWLKKVYDEALESVKNNREIKDIFTREDRIAIFGVGKNMVNSMRFWSEKSNILQNNNNKLEISKIAKIILDDKSGDPYMENPSSSWLIHWELASNSDLTSCFYIFNNYMQPDIDKEKIQKQIIELVNEKGLNTSPNTIKKDIDCYIQMYCSQNNSKSIEEQMSSALSELGLIFKGENKKNYLSRGPKPSLAIDVFVYSLIRFWRKYDSSSKTMSAEAIIYEPGSPGRVFLLGEEDVISYMYDVKKVIQELEFNESAGLQQIVSFVDINSLDELSIIEKMYKNA